MFNRKKAPAAEGMKYMIDVLIDKTKNSTISWNNCKNGWKVDIEKRFSIVLSLCIGTFDDKAWIAVEIQEFDDIGWRIHRLNSKVYPNLFKLHNSIVYNEQRVANEIIELLSLKKNLVP